MTKKKAKATGGGANVFVRGADGSLYILSKDKPPRKLNPEQADAVEQILEDANKQVEERLRARIAVASTRGSMVNIDVPSLPELPS